MHFFTTSQRDGYLEDLNGFFRAVQFDSNFDATLAIGFAVADPDLT